MTKNKLEKLDLEKLLPHRDPMLLISELRDIVPMKSATGIINVNKNSFLKDISWSTCYAWSFNS